MFGQSTESEKGVHTFIKSILCEYGSDKRRRRHQSRLLPLHINQQYLWLNDKNNTNLVFSSIFNFNFVKFLWNKYWLFFFRFSFWFAKWWNNKKKWIVYYLNLQVFSRKRSTRYIFEWVFKWLCKLMRSKSSFVFFLFNFFLVFFLSILRLQNNLMFLVGHSNQYPFCSIYVRMWAAIWKNQH